MSILEIAAVVAADKAAAAGEAASGGSSGGLPQLDLTTYPSQVFWLLVTFGVLYWVMSAFILPKLGGVIEERRDRIADDLDQAAEFKRQAEEAETAYNQALSDAKAKAQKIAAETREAVDAEIAALQAEANAKAASDIEAAEGRINDMKAQAAEKVREAAIDTARTIVEALIDERLTEDVIAAAVPAQ